jgi:hypothetical protein
MPLALIGNNVQLTDFQDNSLTGIAPVLRFEFGAETAAGCPLITRVIIGQSDAAVNNFSATHQELPLPQSSGSCLAGDANIVHLAADGTEASRAPRFLFVSGTDTSVNPPTATAIGLARDAAGLPAPLQTNYISGLQTCYKQVNDEAIRLQRVVDTLEQALNNFKLGA